ncbi:MAG TPA: RodZ domain-containing protein [Candidatus Acidoferrales bacterium]|nr:RodZ domain-containing protein [Candidatus Acidoferrales bacterium]
MTPPSPDDAALPGASKEGFGARLRKAREARGLSVFELADALRLSPRMIEAIESEDLGALPPMLFAKGYLRSYAAFVGIDPSGLLKDFEARAATDTVLQPPPPMRRPIGDLNDVKRGRQLASLILLVLALSALAWWWSQATDPTAPVPVSGNASDLVEAGLSSAGLDELALGEVPSATADRTVVAEPSGVAVDHGTGTGTDLLIERGDLQGNDSADQPSSVRQETVTEPLPAVSAATQPSGTQAPPPDVAMARLTIRYAQDCWTEVRDARGRQLIYRLAKAGTEQEATGTPPFSLYLGYAPGVSVEIDGKPVDLSSFVGNSTVARIKLDRTQE